MKRRILIVLGIISIFFICFITSYSILQDYNINYPDNMQDNLVDIISNFPSDFNFLGLNHNDDKNVSMDTANFYVKENVNGSQFKKGLNEKFELINPSKYLQSGGSSVISDSIQSKADSVTKNCSNEWDVASALFNYTKSIKYTPYYQGSKYDATKVMSVEEANCCDHANLFIALCRAKGIPARYVSVGDCYFYDYDLRMGHVWAQVCLNGTWYSADATSQNNQIGNIVSWDVSEFNSANYLIYN